MAHEDYYKILGLSNNASAEEIKKHAGNWRCNIILAVIMVWTAYAGEKSIVLNSLYGK
jgi:hypothetical protein